MSNNDTHSRAERRDHNRSAQNQPHVQFPPMPDGVGQRASRESSHLEPIERPESPSGIRKSSPSIGRSKANHLHSFMCSVLAHGGDLRQAYGIATASRISEHARKICEALEASDDRFCPCRRPRTRQGRDHCPKCSGGGRRQRNASRDQHRRETEAGGGEASADAPARTEPVHPPQPQPPFANRGVVHPQTGGEE